MVRAVLLDDRTAPIPERLRRVLAFLEKLTLRPAEVGPEDMAPLREVGLTDREIGEALHICAAFNMMNRVSDALGFETMSPEAYRVGARFLLGKKL